MRRLQITVQSLRYVRYVYIAQTAVGVARGTAEFGTALLWPAMGAALEEMLDI